MKERDLVLCGNLLSKYAGVDSYVVSFATLLSHSVDCSISALGVDKEEMERVSRFSRLMTDEGAHYLFICHARLSEDGEKVYDAFAIPAVDLVDHFSIDCFNTVLCRIFGVVVERCSEE